MEDKEYMPINFHQAVVDLRDSKTGHVIVGALAGGLAVAVTLVANSLQSQPSDTVNGALIAAIVPLVLLAARALNKYSQDELNVKTVTVPQGSIVTTPGQLGRSEPGTIVK